MEFFSKDIPHFTIRAKVPNLPGANSQKRKVAAKYEGTKKQIHLEMDVGDKPFFKALIDVGKKFNIFKEYWGPHVHITEVVSWESPPGDLKRAESFATKSMNYNASLTATDIDGFLNLNNTIDVVKNGKVLATLTGRECILSFFKFGAQNSTLFAEVHQGRGSSVIQLVYPNTREAEALVNGMMKHAGGFILNIMRDQGVDEQFIWKFLKTFVEPPLLHTATECKWDSEDKHLTTPEELEDDSGDLEQQAWFLDIVEMVEDKKTAAKKNGYAEKKALFDLDVANSVKTMHQKNDVAEMEIDDMEDEEEEAESAVESPMSDKQKEMQKKKHMAEEKRLNSEDVTTIGDDDDDVVYSDVEEGEETLQEEVNGTESASGKQTGDTPESGRVRFSLGDDEASTGTNVSSGVESMTQHACSTASDAVNKSSTNETGEEG
jgi:hypothetical protein